MCYFPFNLIKKTNDFKIFDLSNRGLNGFCNQTEKPVLNQTVASLNVRNLSHLVKHKVIFKYFYLDVEQKSRFLLAFFEDI